MLGTILRELVDVLSFTLMLALRAVVSLRDNWGLALVAVVLSTALWIAVTNEQNPPKVDVFPATLAVEPVNVPPGLGLFRAIDPVKVKISAPQDSWSRLTPSSFKTVVDLSRYSQGMQEVPVKVESADRQVRVLEVMPSKVPVRLDLVVEKTVPVRVNLLDSVPFGYTLKTPSASPGKVKAIGPEALVNQVEAAIADLELGGAKVSISQSTNLSARDAQGSRVEGVRLDPQAAVIDVAIEQQLHYVTVPVNPTVTGDVAGGYWVAGISVSPSTVTVVGDRESVQPINFISTDPVDVTGVNSDAVRSVGLSAPAGISLIGAQKVTVRVTVAASEGKKTFAVSPAYTGLSADRRADPASIDVVVSGPTPLLQRTDVSQITATVDLSGYISGTYKLNPKISVPDGLRLVRVSPELVDVHIR